MRIDPTRPWLVFASPGLPPPQKAAAGSLQPLDLTRRACAAESVWGRRHYIQHVYNSPPLTIDIALDGASCRVAWLGACGARMATDDTGGGLAGVASLRPWIAAPSHCRPKQAMMEASREWKPMMEAGGVAWRGVG